MSSMLETHETATESIRRESLLFKQKFEDLKEIHGANEKQLAEYQKEIEVLKLELRSKTESMSSSQQAEKMKEQL